MHYDLRTILIEKYFWGKTFFYKKNTMEKYLSCLTISQFTYLNLIPIVWVWNFCHAAILSLFTFKSELLLCCSVMLFVAPGASLDSWKLSVRKFHFQHKLKSSLLFVWENDFFPEFEFDRPVFVSLYIGMPHKVYTNQLNIVT